MRIVYRIVIILSVLAVGACTLKPMLPAPPKTTTAEEAILDTASGLMAAGEYTETIQQCNKLLATYPKSELADDALLLKAAARIALGDTLKAEKNLQNLEKRFPDSPLRYEARYLRLLAIFTENRHRDVIDEAGLMLEQHIPDSVSVKVYALLGDSYINLGFPADAFAAYAKGSALAGETEMESIVVRLRDGAALLTLEETVNLLKIITDRQSKGYLFLRLGEAYGEKGLYTEATEALYAFLEKYPDHREAFAAREMIDDLMRKSKYDRYTIGCLLPLSGPYKVFGERALKGIEFAFSQFSEGRDETFRIVVRDTGGDPLTTATAFQELVDENVAAILGPISTAEYAAIDAQENGIPIITMTQKEQVTEIGDYVFRNFLTPQAQAERLVSYAAIDRGMDKFAVLYPDEKYGWRFMNLFWDEVIARRGEIVGVETYAASEMDYSEPVKKLVGLYFDVPGELAASDKNVPASLTDIVREYKRVTGRSDIYIPVKKKIERTDGTEEPEPIVDFNAIFIPDAPVKSALVVPQLAYHNVSDVLILGTNLWYTDQMLEMADTYLQNAVITVGFFPESSSPLVSEFVTDFRDAYGKEPGYIEAVSYDSTAILFTILLRPDVNHRLSFRDALVDMESFRGVTGPVSFNAAGELRSTPYLLQVKGKTFVELYPPEVRSVKVPLTRQPD